MGAVFAGLLAIVILSIGSDIALHAADGSSRLGQPMSDALFLIATAYRTAYGVAGAYITARLAPNRPMQHALALGAIGVLLGIVGAALTWNRGPEFGPHWYPLALVLIALPSTRLGGVLHRVRQ